MQRERRGVPIIALVGYTNAGKSTLLNQLTGADVLVADQLFATLDTTARRFELPDGREAVVTDTVGFVRKLPTQLVEAFKSTLEDTLHADLLLHVVDAAHPEAEMQAASVDRVLDEIGAAAMPRLIVLNKADLADPNELIGLRRRFGDAVVVSARTGEGVEALLTAVASRIPADRRLVEALVPYDRTDLVARAHREGEVLKSEARPEGTWMLVNIDRSVLAALEPYMNGSTP
jgi:GTP-binding protein HflX